MKLPFVVNKKGGVKWLIASPAPKLEKAKPKEFADWIRKQLKLKVLSDSEGPIELIGFPPSADSEILYLVLSRLEGVIVYHLRKHPKKAELPKAEAQQLEYLRNRPESEYTRYFSRSDQLWILRKIVQQWERAQRVLRIGSAHIARPFREAIESGLISGGSEQAELQLILNEMVEAGEEYEEKLLALVSKLAGKFGAYGYLFEQPGLGKRTAPRIVAVGPANRFNRDGFLALAGLFPGSNPKAGSELIRSPLLFGAFLQWRLRLIMASEQYNVDLEPDQDKTLKEEIVLAGSNQQQLARAYIKYNQWGSLYWLYRSGTASLSQALKEKETEEEDGAGMKAMAAAKKTAAKFARKLWREIQARPADFEGVNWWE